MKDEQKEWRKQERDRFVDNALRQMPLTERIAAAKKHAIEHGQMGDVLWSYQAFSLTVGELLNAAERTA